MRDTIRKPAAWILAVCLFAGVSVPVTADSEAEQTISVPEFSLKSGFYDREQELTITAEPGMTIYYTTDGSVPDSSSKVYTGAILLKDISSEKNVLSARTDISPKVQTMWGMSGVSAPASAVDKANVIRAVSADSEGNFSSPVTGTYFIHYQDKKGYYQDTKIISLVTDSDNLFDYEKGIYVLGKVHDDWKNGSDYDASVPTYFMPANYTQKGKEWEREAVMQIFEGGQLTLSQNIGIRIHGGATRSESQKSMNIYARKEYGSGSVKYDLFSGNVKNISGQEIKKFDSFILRNGGNDCSYTRWRDKLNQTLVSDRAFLTQGMTPAIVFLDGEYWGHYEITEKLSEDFIQDHYGVSKKNVCIIKNHELDEGDESGFQEFQQLWDWLKHTDFSDDSTYAELAQKIDMQSFADYISAEIYINNCDWGENNMALWKSMQTDSSNPYADGRWRFVMFDTEYSTGLYGTCQANQDSFESLLKQECFLSDLFRCASQNEQFRRQFALTFMDIANDCFDTDKTAELINQLYEEYHDMTLDAYSRFWSDSKGNFMAERSYTSEKNTVANFYRGRFTPITNALKKQFSLKGNLCRLTIENDSQKGTVQLNTIMPEMKNGTWEGKYFSDYPVTLQAVRETGWELAYWKTDSGQKLYETSLELPVTGDMKITAVYQEKETLKGDVNADGVFDVADIITLQKFLLHVPDVHLADWKAADFQENGQLNIYDLCLMKKALMN